jgi:hypothetical protein
MAGMSRGGRHNSRHGRIALSPGHQEEIPLGRELRKLDVEAALLIRWVAPGVVQEVEPPDRIVDSGACNRSALIVDHTAFDPQPSEQELTIGLIAERGHLRRPRRP